MKTWLQLLHQFDIRCLNHSVIHGGITTIALLLIGCKVQLIESRFQSLVCTSKLQVFVCRTHINVFVMLFTIKFSIILISYSFPRHLIFICSRNEWFSFYFFSYTTFILFGMRQSICIYSNVSTFLCCL